MTVSQPGSPTAANRHSESSVRLLPGPLGGLAHIFVLHFKSCTWTHEQQSTGPAMAENGRHWGSAFTCAHLRGHLSVSTPAFPCCTVASSGLTTPRSSAVSLPDWRRPLVPPDSPSPQSTRAPVPDVLTLFRSCMLLRPKSSSVMHWGWW